MERLRRQAADLWHGWYAREIIDAWQAAERPALLRNSAARGSRLFVIGSGSSLAAFGSVHPGDGVLEGLFVHPDHAGGGLVGQLLEHMLALADTAGCPQLEVEASLNAQSFYARYGFEAYASGALEVAPGLELAFVRMLRSQPSRA